MDKKTNGKDRNAAPRKRGRPQKKPSYDPWGEICKKYGEKNHWPSAKRPPNKKGK